MFINSKKIFLSLTVLFLSACVTENYENNSEKPVVYNETSNNELAMTRISLGLGYLNMGNTTQAKLNLEKAKRHAPNLVQVHTSFAHYYETVGEPELAIESFETALKSAPNDADTLNNYGVFLCRQERYDEAEQQILKAIAIPTYLLVSQSYENLALCQLKDNRFDDAQESFEKSIKHNPSNANAYLQMVQLQYAKQHYKEAQRYLTKYEKATRRFSPESLALAYKIYKKQRQHGTAKNYASMLVKMFPNSSQSKQYILNGLASIEADKLAERYYLETIGQKADPNKRVVVLSPNKDGRASTKKVKNSNDNTVNKQVIKPSAITAKVSNESTQKQPAEPDNKSLIKKEKSAVENVSKKSVSVPIHTVVKGDSLYSISIKYNIQLRALKKWNNHHDSDILSISDLIYLADPKKVQ